MGFPCLDCFAREINGIEGHTFCTVLTPLNVQLEIDWQTWTCELMLKARHLLILSQGYRDNPRPSVDLKS